jgi:hypothetical protein
MTATRAPTVAARARDATRLELLVRFFIINIFFSLTNVYFRYSTRQNGDSGGGGGKSSTGSRHGQQRQAATTTVTHHHHPPSPGPG